MNKAGLLKIVNVALFASFAAQVVTSLIIFFRIKTAYTAVIFKTHEYNGLFMIMLACAHLTLNWGWIKASFFKKR